MDPSSAAILAAVIASLGIGGTLVAVVNGVVQRRKVGADATVVVIAAARELVDPLRAELKTERLERADERRLHLDEIRVQKERLSEVRAEVLALEQTARACRGLLRGVRKDLEAMRVSRDHFRDD